MHIVIQVWNILPCANKGLHPFAYLSIRTHIHTNDVPDIKFNDY